MNIRVVVGIFCLCSSNVLADPKTDGSRPLPCSTTMAFDQQFGTTQLNGFIRFSPLAALVKPQEYHKPFTEIEVSLTAKSKRIWGAVGSATFDSAASAKSFIEYLAARFESTLPISEKVVKEAENKIILYTGTSSRCQEIRGETKCYHSDGAKFEFTYFYFNKEHNVALGCNDIAMDGVLISEAMSKK